MPANLMLLDEPTNHLDIPSQEALQAVLEHFQGTILMVSNDRYLIDQLGSQIWELREGRLNAFDGTYREFVLQRSVSKSQPERMLLPAKPMARDQPGDTQQQPALELPRSHPEQETVQHISQSLSWRNSMSYRAQ
jgi:ATP-binding cassette subfamily F protein 3